MTERGQAPLDSLVETILGGADIATWQQSRRAWRDVAMEGKMMLVRGLDVAALACDAVKDVLASMVWHRCSPSGECLA